MLATNNAMLNFEMSKTMYISYFSNEIHLNLAEIDYRLGLVYLDLRDYDNALKCLSNTYSLRV